ncbi:hypothetical protein MNBD_GAMMA04-337 [hydrothermal vent metagenome]|uniref:Cytochrome c domain-containing protein n=1 Tax=hydrothermal vent metagenome TaxID=652676 RepID=A0A3B0WKB5_9ZZZZ
MYKKIGFIVASSALLAACSGTNDYTPATGATGENMYIAACASCHTGEFSHWQMTTPEEANPEYVKKMIAEGTMGMPAFPNIKGEELETLTQFVLSKNAK